MRGLGLYPSRALAFLWFSVSVWGSRIQLLARFSRGSCFVFESFDDHARSPKPRIKRASNPMWFTVVASGPRHARPLEDVTLNPKP